MLQESKKRPCLSIHDLVSVTKLFVRFSLILVYHFFFTKSCEAGSSCVKMERHTLLKVINEMLPVFSTFFIQFG
jgi:hypothetical protein